MNPVLANGAAVVYWINLLPCNPGVAGSIPGFTSLSDESKPWPLLHMTLAVGGTLNTNTTTTVLGNCYRVLSY